MEQPTASAVNAIWLILVAWITLYLSAAILGLEPPPMPLDPDGHAAPYGDSPLFGI